MDYIRLFELIFIIYFVISNLIVFSALELDNKDVNHVLSNLFPRPIEIVDVILVWAIVERLETYTVNKKRSRSILYALMFLDVFKDIPDDRLCEKLKWMFLLPNNSYKATFNVSFSNQDKEFKANFRYIGELKEVVICRTGFSKAYALCKVAMDWNELMRKDLKV